MENIEEIRLLDDRIFEEYKVYFPKTENCTYKKKFPKTFLLGNMYDISAGFLKNSIFDSCESKDIYGLKVLLRSLIEIFIRYELLFLTWYSEKDDSFAKDNIQWGEANEVLASLNAFSSKSKLMGQKVEDSDVNSILNNHPKTKDKSKTQIRNQAKKHAFKNVINRINDLMVNGDSENKEFLGNLITEYSELSSFVHSSIGSYNIMMSYNEKSRNDEYLRVASLAFEMSSTIKELNLVLYCNEDSNVFEKHHKAILNIKGL